MKRILAGIILVVMLFVLCACREQQPQESGPETSTGETTKPTIPEDPTFKVEGEAHVGRI